MAKTRMKTTPTRLQQGALLTTTAGATSSTTTVAANEKSLRHSAVIKEQLHTTSTIIVAAPKRTNSISSATSSISHASDTHSAHSDTESPPPLTMLSNVATMPRTLNSLMCKPHAASGAPKNRKVFMITEKCEPTGANGESCHSGAGQKRKMYLIMEEDPTQQDGETQLDAQAVNGLLAAKKLTLFADKSDGELTQKFEQILPEILNRIQGKSLPKQAQNGAAAQLAASEPAALLAASERLPITLPPKKNRTKIINSNGNVSHNNILLNNSLNGSHAAHVNGYHQHATPKLQTSAATPVIVSAPSSLASSQCNGKPTVVKLLPPPPQQAQLPPQKNINLSTDFLFLMKMLPKLESIPEPHKNHVKNCIEKIIMQNATNFASTD